jgi:hypothetical protein
LGDSGNHHSARQEIDQAHVSKIRQPMDIARFGSQRFPLTSQPNRHRQRRWLQKFAGRDGNKRGGSKGVGRQAVVSGGRRQ